MLLSFFSIQHYTEVGQVLKHTFFIAVKNSILILNFNLPKFGKQVKFQFHNGNTYYMCNFADLDSCIYYIYMILLISLVLNRPLCYNQFHAKILSPVKKAKINQNKSTRSQQTNQQKLNQREKNTEGNIVVLVILPVLFILIMK